MDVLHKWEQLSSYFVMDITSSAIPSYIISEDNKLKYNIKFFRNVD